MAPNWDSVRNEATRYLQDLVRMDTTNPPGNESRAADYLANVLNREGIPPTVLAAVPGRGNVVARLAGSGRAAPLLLMVHVDVVPAEAESWTRPPYSGDVHAGFVWGRGTLDTKQLAAMELLTLLLLKREGVPLERDVIFMANADEETGGELGAGWMVKCHPDLINAEYALNEGGGFGLEVLGERFVACQVAEKGTGRFAMRARGRPGHGSLPTSDNAVLKLAQAVHAIGATSLPHQVTPSVSLLVETIAAHVERHHVTDLQALLDPSRYPAAIRRLPIDEGLRILLHAMLHNTVTPTMLSAGTKINVIPSVAEARCDARTLPGQTAEDLIRQVRAVVGDDIELETLDDTPAREFDHRTPLFEAIRRVSLRHAPRATLLPYVIAGATDARHVGKLGTKVYGFSPMFAPTTELDRVHGHDERISVDNLAFGTRVLYELVREFCTT